MNLKFRVEGKIRKPVEEVFDAAYNPVKLSKYFTTGGASGPLDPGSTRVQIDESGWKETQKGLDGSYGNCQGWMNIEFFF